ncbi:MAG: hypothetical protein MUP13_14540 [Thermoanaerobaculales bacterium]|nr:hypothetical protein [Thermoanaerobaculales bacterium]
MPIVTAARLVATEVTRRWAALLRGLFEVDPLTCPRCPGTMRIIAVITHAAVIDQILTHLRTRTTAPGEPSPPSTHAPAIWGAPRRPLATPASQPAPDTHPGHPGSPVGDVRGAHRSGLEPPPVDHDAPRGRPDDPKHEPRRGRPRLDRARGGGAAGSIVRYSYDID